MSMSTTATPELPPSRYCISMRYTFTDGFRVRFEMIHHIQQTTGQDALDDCSRENDSDVQVPEHKCIYLLNGLSE